MADLAITSLRGGMNNTDPAIGLPEDQCVLAQNVEFVDSMLGERRLGTTAISLPSFLSARDRVTFLFRHLTTSDETAAQLLALGVTGTSTAKFGYKTTSWSEVTISDTPDLTGFSQYRWQAVSLHGKAHLFYPSNVDRPHVLVDGAMRRSGLTEPAAPTAADQGAAAINAVRYYRVRYTEQVASVTVRRSEPSDVLTHDPTNASAVRVTKPAAISEGETHWELEASTDNANFYRIATTAVGTTTYDDSTADGAGYTSGTLSEDVGDYTLLWSARYAVADGDRLIIAGSWEDDDLASQVGWTPVFNASGVGNDERMESDTDPTLNLDTYEHGPITGMSPPVFGAIWVFKQHAIYKLTRSGKRTAAYVADKFTDALGAVHGSVMSGLDETGQPCIYFLDHEQGPCRIGIGGIKRCGEDLRKTWELLSVNATAVVASCGYYPLKKQAIWNIAVSAGNAPTQAIVLHTDKSRTYPDGVRKGWALWTGNRAKALAMCLFADNIDDNAARSLKLVPFIGLEGLGLVHRCDTGTADNSVAYAATVTTKPYWMKSPAHHFEVRAAALMGKAVTNAKVDAKCIRDFGLETTVTVSDVTFTASASETEVTNLLDNFKGAEMEVGQFQFTDVASPSAQWQLNRLDIVGTEGQAP